MAFEFDTRYYKCKLIKIQDTNILRVNIKCVGGVCLENRKIRFYGVIMPKWRSKDPDVKKSADLCMEEIKKFLVIGEEYTLKIYGNDILYFDVFPDKLQGKSLNKYLLKNGFALNHYIKDLL